MKWRTAFLLATLVVGVLAIQPVAAQSGGCAGGPFTGATTLDSDGDGVSDANEVTAGTDQCDPGDAPTSVCDEFVANYDASVADSDGDGVTDAIENSSGTDACSATDTPTAVCGAYVASYNSSTFDADNDGGTDAAEIAGGTDPCDATSVLGAAAAQVTTTTTEAPATTAPTTTVAAGAADEVAELALTGPSTAALGLLVALVMMILGMASLAVGRRVEA